MVKKQKQKKKKPFKNDGKSNKELNTLIEKKIQKFVKNKKRRKTEKECSFQMMKAKRVYQALQKVEKVEKSHPPALNEKRGQIICYMFKF